MIDTVYGSWPGFNVQIRNGPPTPLACRSDRLQIRTEQRYHETTSLWRITVTCSVCMRYFRASCYPKRGPFPIVRDPPTSVFYTRRQTNGGHVVESCARSGMFNETGTTLSLN